MSESKSTVKELEDKVDLFAYIQQSYNLKVLKSGHSYRVDPCPICNHKEHFTVYPKTNSYSSFSECCGGGSVYKYLIEVEKLTPNEAYKKLQSLAGDTTIHRTEKPYDIEKQYEYKEDHSPKDYTKFVEIGYAQSIKNYRNELLEFAKLRKISIEAIVKYSLFVYKFKDGLRLVIPEWQNDKVVSYSARALEEQEPKYKNSPGQKNENGFFGIEEVFIESDKPIIVVESQINKITLEQLGFRAISINGTQNFQKFLDYITKTKIIDKQIFVTAFDNDDGGNKITSHSPFKAIKVPLQYNDINEWFVDSIKNLTPDNQGDIKNLEIYQEIFVHLATPTKKDSVLDYLMDSYEEDLEKHNSWSNVKTGFGNIDAHIGHIHPALYVIGGVPSIGKTTLIQQMSGGIIDCGCEVVMFSYEQTKMELVNKALKRIKSVSKKPLTTREAMEIYAPTAINYSIVEANFKMTVDDIRTYMENYQRMNKKQVVLMVDFLQVIAGISDTMEQRTKVDRNLMELKTMSKDLGLPIFVISSLNRTSYADPIDFNAFKESGAIEYCADFLMGIQLAVVNELEKKTEVQKKAILNKEKAKKVRDVEIVGLKGRNTAPNFVAKFDYHSDKDYFVEKK